MSGSWAVTHANSAQVCHVGWCIGLTHKIPPSSLQTALSQSLNLLQVQLPCRWKSLRSTSSQHSPSLTFPPTNASLYNQSTVPVSGSAWVPQPSMPKSSLPVGWCAGLEPGSQTSCICADLELQPSTHPRSMPCLPAHHDSMVVGLPLPSNQQPGESPASFCLPGHKYPCPCTTPLTLNP